MKVLGINIVCIQRVNSNEMITLKNGEENMLCEGDILFLVGNCYPFKLQRHQSSNLQLVEASPVKVGEKRNSDSSESNLECPWLKKSKTSPSKSIVDEEQPLLLKKNQTSSNSNESTASTISTNKNGDASKTEINLVNQIMEILPDFSRSDILKAVQETKGNLEESVDLLLTKKQDFSSLTNNNGNNNTTILNNVILDEIEEEKLLKQKEEELTNQRLIIELLSKEKEQIEDKNRSLQMQKVELEIERYMPGELEALKGTHIKRYFLKPARHSVLSLILNMN